MIKNVIALALVLSMAFCTGAFATEEPVAQVMDAPVVKAAEAAPAVSAAAVEVANPAVVTTYAAQPSVAEQTAAVQETVAAEPVQTATESGPVCTVSGGGYVVDILGAEKAKDGLGGDCITVRFKFTNNNSTPIAFAFIEMDTVRQNGKVLSCDGMVIDPSIDPDVMGLCQQVSNGQSVNIALVYPYYSSDPLDFSLTLVKDLNSIVPLGSGSCTLTVK